ncbi:MAG TPA: HAD family hydrolase [Candidatus Angelobacter sp.]|nr:HAD family hydrolase [Candidatus Angelobacter sp.]
MTFHLACDYDETLASGGQVGAPAREALARLKAGGSKILLVTGRELEDLVQIFPDIPLFDLVIAENGAVLHRPAGGDTRTLTGPPLPVFLDKLRLRGVEPLRAGRAVVATTQKHYAAVWQTIAEMNLPLEIILNRDSLMVLPLGVDKGSGFKAALKELQIPAQSVVGIGDAENDSPFLELCGVSVAVANALPAIREAADVVTEQPSGAGVVEVISKLMTGELLPGQNRDLARR